MIENIVNPEDTPDNWSFKQLSEIADMKGGTSVDQNEDRTGYPVTRIETIASGQIDPKAVNHVDVERGGKVYQKHIMEQGDILFSNINSPKHVGKTALYDGNPEGANPWYEPYINQT